MTNKTSRTTQDAGAAEESKSLISQEINPQEATNPKEFGKALASKGLIEYCEQWESEGFADATHHAQELTRRYRGMVYVDELSHHTTVIFDDEDIDGYEYLWDEDGELRPNIISFGMNDLTIARRVQLYDLGEEKHKKMYATIDEWKQDGYFCPLDIMKTCNEDGIFKGDLSKGTKFILGERLGNTNDYFDDVLFVTNTNWAITYRKSKGRIKYGIFYVTLDTAELHNECDSIEEAFEYLQKE